MTKQEYKHIRNLAWDLLIDAKISQLPVDINAIASLYNLQYLIDISKPLYDNALSVSEGILKIFGLNEQNFSKYLAIRILSPLIVFDKLRVNSPKEINELSKLPMYIANQRFERLKMLSSQNVFGTSKIENTVLSQFSKWIELINF